MPSNQMVVKNKKNEEMTIQNVSNFVKGAFENVEKSICNFISKSNNEQREIIKEEIAVIKK